MGGSASPGLVAAARQGQAAGPPCHSPRPEARPKGRLLRTLALLTLLAALPLILLVAGCTSADEVSAQGTDGQTQTSDGTSPETQPGADQPPVQQLPQEPASPPASLDITTQSDRLSPEQGPFSICPDCHAYLDPPGQVPRTLKANFSHEKHLERGATCESCHDLPVHTVDGIRYPQMTTCFDCHGDTPEATAPGECSLCHPDDFDLVPASHGPQFYEQTHPQVAAERGADYCALCHEGSAETVCEQCHGLQMPHPSGFILGPQGGPGEHVQTAFANPDLCTRCHEIRSEPPASCYGPECHGV